MKIDLLRMRTESIAGVVLLAVGLTAAATVLRLALGLVVPEVVPFATFFLAVIAGALAGGRAGGLVTVALSSAVCWILFLPGEFPDDGTSRLVNLLLFVAISVAMVLVAAGLRRALVTSAEQERRLARAHKAGALGEWDWDLATGRFTWSDEVLRILGQTRESLGTTRDAFRDIVHPDDRSAAEAAMSKALASGDRFDLAVRILHPERGVRHVVGRGEIVRDEAGKATSVIGITMDVTERREAELALVASQERYRMLFESMSEGFVVGELVRDGSGEAVDVRVLDANPAVERITGVGLDRLIGRLRSDLGPPGDPAQQAIYRRVVECGRAERAEFYVASIARWVDLRVFPVGADRFGAMFVDITDVRSAERERDAAEARLAAAMQIAEMGVYDVDVATMQVACSDSMDLIFGLDPARPAKAADDYLSRISPEDLADARVALETTLAGTSAVTMEYRVTDANGVSRWVASRGAVMTDETGRKRLVGAVFDTTTRKVLEMDLSAARDRAETLFFEMNHRIKNNLHMVASLLRLQEARLDDAEARAALKAARERIANIADLHTGFYKSANTGAIDFAAFVEDLGLRVEGSLGPGRHVRFVMETQPVFLSGDVAVPLGLVVNELVTNAVKHAFDGIADPAIRIVLRPDGDRVLLTVEDNGRGLASDWSGRSDGLGSRLVDAFVRQIGAELRVETNGGTRVEIRAPVTVADAAESERKLA